MSRSLLNRWRCMGEGGEEADCVVERSVVEGDSVWGVKANRTKQGDRRCAVCSFAYEQASAQTALRSRHAYHTACPAGLWLASSSHLERWHVIEKNSQNFFFSLNFNTLQIAGVTTHVERKCMSVSQQTLGSRQTTPRAGHQPLPGCI